MSEAFRLLREGSISTLHYIYGILASALSRGRLNSIQGWISWRTVAADRGIDNSQATTICWVLTDERGAESTLDTYIARSVLKKKNKELSSPLMFDLSFLLVVSNLSLRSMHAKPHQSPVKTYFDCSTTRRSGVGVVLGKHHEYEFHSFSPMQRGSPSTQMNEWKRK